MRSFTLPGQTCAKVSGTVAHSDRVCRLVFEPETGNFWRCRGAGGNHLISDIVTAQPAGTHPCDFWRSSPAYTSRRINSSPYAYQKAAAAALPAEWDGLISTIIALLRVRDVFHTQSGEWRKTVKVAYYASDCASTMEAKRYAQAIRGHWSIENCQHYVRDVSLGEDHSRTFNFTP